MDIRKLRRRWLIYWNLWSLQDRIKQKLKYIKPVYFSFFSFICGIYLKYYAFDVIYNDITSSDITFNNIKCDDVEVKRYFDLNDIELLRTACSNNSQNIRNSHIFLCKMASYSYFDGSQCQKSLCGQACIGLLPLIYNNKI